MDTHRFKELLIDIFDIPYKNNRLPRHLYAISLYTHTCTYHTYYKVGSWLNNAVRRRTSFKTMSKTVIVSRFATGSAPHCPNASLKALLLAGSKMKVKIVLSEEKNTRTKKDQSQAQRWQKRRNDWDQKSVERPL